MTTKPIFEVPLGAIRACVWENQSADGNAFCQVTVTRSYKDKDDQWKDTHSFRRDDLPKVSFALSKCFEFILSRDYDLAQHQEHQPVLGEHTAKAKGGRS